MVFYLSETIMSTNIIILFTVVLEQWVFPSYGLYDSEIPNWDRSKSLRTFGQSGTHLAQDLHQQPVEHLLLRSRLAASPVNLTINFSIGWFETFLRLKWHLKESCRHWKLRKRIVTFLVFLSAYRPLCFHN